MTQSEFNDWVSFYRAYPFDDLHRFHRPAALIAQAMSGGNIEDRLNWLQPPDWDVDFETADIRTMKALGISR